MSKRKVKKVNTIKVNYNFYYGIPHCHTSYSTGRGSIKDAAECAEKYSLDFLIITDHANYLKNKENTKYQDLKDKIKDINKKNEHFLMLYGYEVSIKNIGHLNVINSSKLINTKITDLKQLVKFLKDAKDTIISFNHPGNNIKKCKHDSKVNKLIKLIEVGNGCIKVRYKNYEKCLYKILDNGWKIGVINSQDNHRADWGKSSNLTGVLCESLDKKSLMDALKKRRTFSTETRSLKLAVAANDCFMGSVLKQKNNKKINFKIRAYDKAASISCIQIISNGGHVIQEKRFDNVNDALWDIKIDPKKENTWYIAKVIHSDGRVGIASPIFIEK